MLMPVSQMPAGQMAQMPAWGMQMQQVAPQHRGQEHAILPEFKPPFSSEQGNAVESLEAKAAALAAYAAEMRAEARKAKAAAAAAARRSMPSEKTAMWANIPGGDKVEMRKTQVMQQPDATGRKCSEETPRWTDMADTGFHVNLQRADGEEISNDDRTTLMFRNLPNNYDRSALLLMLDSEGFKGSYDLVYLPTDFAKFACFGYAFVNFAKHEDAKRAKTSFQGFAHWRVPSRKICDVEWSGPVQGLEAHIERYRNSPVMHDSVPDEYKPAVFVNGLRASFPAPSKRIRPPRVRHSVADGVMIERSGRGARQ